MYQIIKKTFTPGRVVRFLKVSALSVFSMIHVKAMDQANVALITVGVLLLGFIVAFIWGRIGSGNEA